MSNKIELLLRQLNGLEQYLALGEVEATRDAICGIRHMLLSTEIDRIQTTVTTSRPDLAKLRSALDVLRKSSRNGAVVERSLKCCYFTEKIVCWGWHDIQFDKSGRSYRWCGGEAEAGVRLPYDPTETLALVLSMRAFEPEKFTPNSVDLQVNGKAAPLIFLSKPGSTFVDVAIFPPENIANGEVEISFFVKYSSSPQKINPESSDRRQLTFYISEFIWLPRT